MCLKHFSYLLSFQPESMAVLEMRGHIAWYLKGVPGGKELKNEIFKLKNYKEIEKKLLDFEKMC